MITVGVSLGMTVIKLVADITTPLALTNNKHDDVTIMSCTNVLANYVGNFVLRVVTLCGWIKEAAHTLSKILPCLRTVLRLHGGF